MLTAVYRASNSQSVLTECRMCILSAPGAGNGRDRADNKDRAGPFVQTQTYKIIHRPIPLGGNWSKKITESSFDIVE